MKQTLNLFRIGLWQIGRDGMLFIMLPAPLFIALFLKFVIPFANKILEERLLFSISPWYGLVDGILICVSPMFVAMISAFLLLEEKDEGIGAFYQITPASGNTYIFARIVLPMIWAFASTIIVSIIFAISTIGIGAIIMASIVSSLFGIALAMMVVSLAENRVEGLAISKLMGVSFLGLILAWIVSSPYQYFVAFLPSFWIGKIVMNGLNLYDSIFGILVNSLWIIVFTRKFRKKI